MERAPIRTPRSQVRWTELSEAQLRLEWAAGTKTRDIAAKLRLTNGQVCGKAHRLNLPMRLCLDRVNRKRHEEAAKLTPQDRAALERARKDRANAAKRAKRDAARGYPLSKAPKPKRQYRRPKGLPGRICFFVLGYRSRTLL